MRREPNPPSIPAHDDNTKAPCYLSGRIVTVEVLDECSNHHCCYLCSDLGDAWDRLHKNSCVVEDPRTPEAIQWDRDRKLDELARLTEEVGGYDAPKSTPGVIRSFINVMKQLYPTRGKLQ